MRLFNTKSGPPVDDQHFLDRPRLNTDFWAAIQNGSHLLITAPRRTGKTSLLKHQEKQPHNGYKVVYDDVESIRSATEYFKRLYKNLWEELRHSPKDWWQRLTEWRGRVKVEEVGLKGVRIKHQDLDYFEEFCHLLDHIELDHTLVMAVDEFAETLNNIMTDHGEAAARQFLQQNRELRQSSKFATKLQFVYCGSIGLAPLAERLSASRTINDLHILHLAPLNEQEVNALVQQITIPTPPPMPQVTLDYLHQRLGWSIPYFVMLILDQLNSQFRETQAPSISPENIDEAFDALVLDGQPFKPWAERLHSLPNAPYLRTILNEAAKSPQGLGKSKYYDLAKAHNATENYQALIDMLVHDGYLVHTQNKRYVFRSPLLREWWNRKYNL